MEDLIHTAVICAIAWGIVLPYAILKDRREYRRWLWLRDRILPPREERRVFVDKAVLGGWIRRNSQN